MTVYKKSNQRSYKYCTTVFTPTYNRAHTLPNLYESLKRQTCRDFEWLVIDDGSTDGTDELIRKWRSEADFEIRYRWQKNRGKHVAFNVGVRVARGAMFVPIGSDDRLLPNALEMLRFYWASIPLEEQDGFCGVAGLSLDMSGLVIGKAFPETVMDSTIPEMYTRHGVTGDKAGFVLTDVLKQYPFPEIPGERFITESIVWNRVSLNYRTRFVNEAICIKQYLSDGLSASSVAIRAGNPIGARLYYLEFVQLPVALKWKLKNLVNYIRFSFHATVALQQVLNDSPFRFLTMMLLPVGYLLYRKDRTVLMSRQPSETVGAKAASRSQGPRVTLSETS
jgi:glycosyltransferase involved in cell wall biosynthesis